MRVGILRYAACADKQVSVGRDTHGVIPCADKFVKARRDVAVAG